MPFDPKRGGDVGFGGYVNPYSAPVNNQHKNKKPNYVLFAMIAVLVLGIITGVVVYISSSVNQQNTPNQNSSSVVDKSDYVEIEIFDVQEHE